MGRIVIIKKFSKLCKVKSFRMISKIFIISCLAASSFAFVRPQCKTEPVEVESQLCRVGQQKFAAPKKMEKSFSNTLLQMDQYLLMSLIKSVVQLPKPRIAAKKLPEKHVCHQTKL